MNYFWIKLKLLSTYPNFSPSFQLYYYFLCPCHQPFFIAYLVKLIIAFHVVGTSSHRFWALVKYVMFDMKVVGLADQMAHYWKRVPTYGLHTTFVHLITIIIIFFRVMIIIATVFFSIISFGILGFCSTALFQNFKSLVFLFSANIGLFNFPFFLCEPSTFGYFLLSSSISPLYKSFTFLCNLFWLNIVQQVLPVCASKHLNCWLSGQGDQRVSCTKMAFGL